MRDDVPLYQFMPYGAPELLEARRRFMSRALVFTSALALVVYAVAGGIAPLLAVAPEVPEPIVVNPHPIEFLEPPREEVAPAPAPPAAAIVHEHAKPIPVEDDVAPPGEIPAPPTTVSDPPGTGEPIPPGEFRPVGPIAEVLPPLGTWVYVEREPAPTREVKPEYPKLAWEAGVEGRVTVHVLVGREGQVLDAVLAPGVQVPMLNEAALAAARRWRFTPGIANGHPVACWTAIPFHFRIH